MKYNVATINDWLDALQAPHTPLTHWEESFLESVTDQWDTRQWLSDRQREMLERIDAEKTP